jgi:hypothetical protein
MKQEKNKLVKHKKITIEPNSTQLKLYAFGHINKRGDRKCSNVAAEAYLNGFNFKEIFGFSDFEHPERKLNNHFKQIKKKIESANPNCILVLSYGTAITFHKNNGIMIELHMHIKEIDLDVNVLDNQPEIIDLMSKIITDIELSFK